MTPDATKVVAAVRAVLTTQLAWQGTATELLHALAAADGTLALPDNARAMAAHLRGVAPLLRESGIEVSFVRSGHAGTRTIHLAPADHAHASQLCIPDVLTQGDAANAQLGLASPPPSVDPSRSSESRPLAQPHLDAPITVTPAADANAASLIADANSTSAVLTLASDARSDATAPTATDTLTQTAVRCAYCGETETKARPVVLFGAVPDTHTWLHSCCLRAWRAQRRFRAVMAVGGGKLPG